MKNEIQNEGIKNAVVYCRVSSREQVEEGNSLTSQERLCREYALKEGYEVIEAFIEKGESAKTAERKELQKLLAFCTQKKGLVQAVIAYKVDRISRNIADYSYIRVKLKKYGVEIKSVTEYFEDTPAGRFMENIIANVGQFDNDVRAERCTGGMREAMIEGRYVWTAPAGYVNRKVNGKSTIVQTDQAALVKEVFELISQNSLSTEQIRLKMIAKGLVSRRGNSIHRGHFFRLIRNPIYKGVINKFGETHRGTFEPIVSEELFDYVQLVLKGRTNKTKTYIYDNPDFPLRRFVVNGEGKQLTGYWAKGKRKKYAYYSFQHPGSTIAKEVLENKYVAFMARYSFDTRHLNLMKEFLLKYIDENANSENRNSNVIENRVDEVNRKIDHLIGLQEEGGISTKILFNRIGILEKELEELTWLLKAKKSPIINIPELMAFASEVLINPELLWVKSPLEIRQQLQVFDFPKGVVFNGKKFRTPKVCSIYKVKEDFRRAKFLRVDSKDVGKNTVSTHSSKINIIHTKEYWTAIVNELLTLKNILHPTPSIAVSDLSLI
ncbi:MAG: hypothetical protein JWP94_2973 [Mucilaginibacter sp.]|nr:hypothetical protein [Mucilaginibacter sp.]